MGCTCGYFLPPVEGFTDESSVREMRRVPGRPSGSSKIPRLGALVLLAAFITFANYSYYHNKVCPRPTACRHARLDFPRSPGMRAATCGVPTLWDRTDPRGC